MEQLVSFDEIVQALGRACSQSLTGRFHIVTSENHKATFLLEQGLISSVSYRIKRGVVALDAIFKIQSGRWRFERTELLPAPDLGLPDTTNILLKLKSVSEPKVSKLAAPTSPPVTSPKGAVASSPPLSYLPETVQNDLIDLLVQVIGPIASLLVPRALASAQDAETAVNMLAQDISDPYTAEQFKQAAWAVLNGAP